METDHQVSETATPRRGMAWLKAIGCGMLILVLLAALVLFWNREKKASKLQQMLAELDRSDPGWRLEDIEAAREQVPEEENSARVIVDAARLLPKPWPTANFPEEHFRLLPPNEMLSGEDFVRLSRELASARPALTMTAPLADRPRGRHRLHYERNPIATLLTEQQETRPIMSLFVYEAMRQNQRGDSKKALTACRAALNAARSIGDEPLLISQLIRIAGVVLTCRAIERTLGQGEPSPEDMTAMRKLLENEDTTSGLLAAATRGERAAMHQVFEGIERGEISLDELESGLGGKKSNWLKNTAISLWGMDMREDHALFLSLMNRRIQEVQAPMHEQPALEKRYEEEIRRHFVTGPGMPLITRLLLPAMHKVSEAFRRKHALLRCTIVALAAEHYRRDKKAWLANLDTLCPQYLDTVPLDPYDGKPLRYRRMKDGVVIYSVGTDAADNGGHIDRERLTSPGVDIGVRLWDADKRRQPPRPKPAAFKPG